MLNFTNFYHRVRNSTSKSPKASPRPAKIFFRRRVKPSIKRIFAILWQNFNLNIMDGNTWQRKRDSTWTHTVTQAEELIIRDSHYPFLYPPPIPTLGG